MNTIGAIPEAPYNKWMPAIGCRETTIQSRCKQAIAAVIAAIALTALAFYSLPAAIAIGATTAGALLLYKGTELALPHLSGIPRNIALGILTSFRELASLVALAALYPFDLAKKEDVYLADLAQKGEVVPVNQTPVLLIHGWGHNSSGWKKIKADLEKAGIGPVYVVNCGSPWQSIEQNTAAAYAKAEAIACAHGRNDLRIVGHSMGGIVGSYLATQHPEIEVKEVITLGSPLQGTAMAEVGKVITFGQSEAVKQMRSNSPFLHELESNVQKLKESKGVHFVNFTSTTDEIVQPLGRDGFQNSSIADRVTFEQMGHGQYFFSPEVSQELVALLKKPVEEHPL